MTTPLPDDVQHANTPPAGRAGKQRLLTFWSFGWVALLALLVSAYAVFWIISNKRHVVGDGTNVASYQFDLSAVLVDRGEIVAGGMPRDGLVAMTRPEFISVAEVEALNGRQRGRYLLGDDHVIGVSINGDARAYPLQTLTLHEIVNDVVGGVPIAVTYNPLADAAAVMKRKVGDEVLEFGVSGLLHDSAMLMFDRRAGSKGESLWSPLQFRAIAGPMAAKGATLEAVVAQRVPWKVWRAAHGDTKVLGRDPNLVKEYPRKRYATYQASDELKFPAVPLYEGPWPRKTPAAAVRVGSQWRLFVLPALAKMTDAELAKALAWGGESVKLTFHRESQTLEVQAAEGADVANAYAYVFAWYAQHPGVERVE